MPICIALLGLLCSCGKDLPDVDDVCTQMDDINFMNYCYAHFDANGDGKVSMQEAKAVKSISFSGESIFSLKGIEYFTNIVEIKCLGFDISSIDLTRFTQLKRLYSGLMDNVSLDVSNCKNLEHLCCYYSEFLRTVKLSGCNNLKTIDLFRTKVETIDISECADIVTIREPAVYTSFVLSIVSREGQKYTKVTSMPDCY